MYTHTLTMSDSTIHVCMSVHTLTCLYVCTHTYYMSVCLYTHLLHVCMSVHTRTIHVCMSVHMSVHTLTMYVCTHTYYIRQYHQNDYGLQPDHLHVWQDSFISATRLIHMCNMNHSRRWLWSTTVSSVAGVWHDLFSCVSWLLHTCDMTQSICIDDYALQ